MIATGFGAAGADAAGRRRRGADAGRHDATTPISARLRADVPPAPPVERRSPRLSIARRPLLDLPMAAAGGAAAGVGRAGSVGGRDERELDVELGSTFDVPGVPAAAGGLSRPALGPRPVVE